ncbi:nucleoside-diphosphate sugar epimerase/dehydratase [Lentilitoribacter sp. Alg239-R112]|uniref:polysaccharide biosynthesis protein n=1 Tax=Lentilitoribacter sp. Alg239-R112 TaxID=2305987 RepID=UPI0018D604EB|nr:nucleoside-diphosphate sugar epimerase/dehydratase [Lentilitoribacter sp. Alg239-R112]
MKQLSFFERILDRLLSLDRVYKRFLQILSDCILIITCFACAMALRLDGFNFVSTPDVWNVLFIVLPVTIFLFIHLSLYRAVLRFISSRALRTIMFSVFISAVVMFVADQVFVLPVPRSVPIIYTVLLFCAIGGSRFGWRALYRVRTGRQKVNVVIYGAAETGRQLLDAIRYVGDYAVVAFVDDNKELHGQEINSVKVYSPDSLDLLKRRMGATAVLLAAPGASNVQRRKIIERVEKHTLQLRTIPTIGDLISGRAQVSDLKIVQAEELLGRNAVPPRMNLLKAHISDKVVMVTGAGGSIGSELCRQIVLQEPNSLLLFDISEFALYKIHDELETLDPQLETKIIPLVGSVQNKELLEVVLKSFEVQTIYHAAAYKHVPLVEQNVVEGIRNNVFGTKVLVQAAIAAGVETLTLVSTDKAVRPTNFMGASKRIAELICQAYSKGQSHTQISMVRFGNVLGSSGSVIPRFKEQIKAGGPVTVTHPKITRFFMTIPEAAQLVIQAGAMAKGGDVFLLDMGEPVEIADLARRMIRLHGLEPYYEDSSPEEIENGDICIEFSGLRSGEKLYEELLIDGNPIGTEHPRIMCAEENSLDSEELDLKLEKLLQACREFDIEQIKRLFLAMPIEFTPEGELSDLLWLQSDASSKTLKSNTVRSSLNVIDIDRGA